MQTINIPNIISEIDSCLEESADDSVIEREMFDGRLYATLYCSTGGKNFVVFANHHIVGVAEKYSENGAWAIHCIVESGEEWKSWERAVSNAISSSFPLSVVERKAAYIWLDIEDEKILQVKSR